jgi:hypothetical protein
MPDVAATYGDFIRKRQALGSAAEAAIAQLKIYEKMARRARTAMKNPSQNRAGSLGPSLMRVARLSLRLAWLIQRNIRAWVNFDLGEW